MAIMLRIQLSPLLVETIKIYKGDYFTCAVKLKTFGDMTGAISQ